MKNVNFVFVCLVIQVMFVGQSIAGWTSGLSFFQSAMNSVQNAFPVLTPLTSSLSSAAGNAISDMADAYDSNVKFYVTNDYMTKNEWYHATDSLSSIGCDPNGRFAFVVHGWRGFIDTWIDELVNNYVRYRGGCIITMDWNYYAKNPTYPYVVANTWPEVAHLLRRKLDNMVNDEGISADKIHLFGHSLGARMVLDAGMKFGANRLESIDACDPAGPGYSGYDDDPDNDFKQAAKNVQCIHTSSNFGTSTRHCHQDWLMGDCGKSQPGANDLLYACQTLKVCSKGENAAASNSHNRCYQFYNSAFENHFYARNTNGCSGIKEKLPSYFRMGYVERRKSMVRGIIACPTTGDFPFNVDY